MNNDTGVKRCSCPFCQRVECHWTQLPDAKRYECTVCPEYEIAGRASENGVLSKLNKEQRQHYLGLIESRSRLCSRDEIPRVDGDKPTLIEVIKAPRSR